jgi:dUTPase
MSDFLGSCVRLCQDLSNTRNVPLKPVITPFIDEIGDDYGLGAGEAENGPEAHAYMDMERILQELAQNACVGLERSGYYTYSYNYDDVGDCHAEIYGDLDRRHLPYSQNRTEGAVPMEVLRMPRVGGISITSTEVGIRKPAMTETLRTGLTLKSNETATIQQGESVTLATGVRLRSFRGDRIRSAQSVLGPGDKDMIHINACLLTHEDHDTDVEFTITNFGRNPYTVKQGDYIGQLIMFGVDEVILEFIAFKDKTHDLMGPNDTEDDEIIHETKLGELENALAAPTITTNKPWKEYQTHGGPETTKLYDPDDITPEPSGVLQPFASRILMKVLYAARMCRYDLLRAVCGLASCTAKWTH